MKDILDAVYLWTCKKLLTQWIMKYCYLNLITNGIRGISNNWFKSYLSIHKQFVSINVYDSGLAEIICGAPQGSVTGPLLFLLYIDYLNQAIKFCKLHHLVILVIFKSKRKQFDGEIKLKLSHKRLLPTDSVKYLVVKIDGNRSWKSHIDYLSAKLNRSNALLFKIRNIVDSSILRTIYFAIFESHLNCCSLVWSQNCNAINRLVILQKKALRIINFEAHNSRSYSLFKKSFILKFLDKVHLEHTLFVSKSINNLLPSLFNDWFLFSSDQHNYETS